MFDLIALWVGKIFICSITLLGIMGFVSFCIGTIYRKGKHAKYFIRYMAARKKP